MSGASRATWRLLGALALLLGALALACGPSENADPAPTPPPAKDSGAPRTNAAAPQAAAAPRTAPPPPAIELPPRGEARAVRSGDRYTYVSNGAPIADALDALAAEARFEVDGVPPESAAGVRIDLRGVSALDVLRALLADVGFTAHFELDAAGRAMLVRVTLGAPPDAARADAGEVDPEAEQRAESGSDSETDRRAEGEDAAEAERRAAVERDWQDARDFVRLEALDKMEPDLDGEKLATLLRADPSPEVRAAAAEVLAEGDAFSVTEPLVAALDDRDPAVVLAAVRSLEDVYDAVPNPRIRERIAALREHQDANIRAAVEDFEEWIAP